MTGDSDYFRRHFVRSGRISTEQLHLDGQSGQLHLRRPFLQRNCYIGQRVNHQEHFRKFIGRSVGIGGNSLHQRFRPSAKLPGHQSSEEDFAAVLLVGSRLRDPFIGL